MILSRKGMLMKLTAKKAELLLMLVISARATSFMFSKLCLTTMDTFRLLALRFLFAAALLFLFFHRRICQGFSRKTLLSGILIGVLFFSVLTCELIGLKTTDSSTASFLENLAIIIVPLLESAISRRRPERKALLSALFALIGVAFLTLSASGISFSRGDGILLVAAFLYAVSIIVTNRLSRHGDSFVIGFFQVAAIGGLSLFITLITGSLTFPATLAQYGMIGILSVVCTGFGFTLQPVAQSRLSAEKAGTLCALSPLVAGIMGVVFLKETVTPNMLLGDLLILISLLL